MVDRGHQGFSNEQGRNIARDAVILQINGYELHGVRYYQMFLSFSDSPESVREVRLPHDVVYSSPTEGDRVSVEAILSVVTEVKND